MWPFQRKAEVTGPTEPAAVTPQIHFDWKGLPPIQRTVADHPLTIPTEAFASELATHEDPRAVAEPLGHQISLEAPAGIVLGIARPQTRSDGPELIARPGRRPTAQRVADEGPNFLDAPAPEPGTAEEAPVAPAPLRHLPVSAGPVASAQLTRLTPDTAPHPIEAERDVVSARDEPQADPGTADTALETAIELPTYPRLTLGQARRLGLGAPLRRVPDTATSVQRSSDSSSPLTMRPTESASAGTEGDGPQFEPYPLDVLITKRPEVVAPAPISRPQRIPLPLAVSRSAVPEPAGDVTSIEPTDAIAAETEASASPSPATSVQRVAGSTATDGSPADHPIGELAGAPTILAATDPKHTVLTDTATGEAEEGTAGPLPALPLAGPVVEPFAATGDREDDRGAGHATDVTALKPTRDQALAPLVSARPYLASSDRPQLATVVQRTMNSTPASASTAGGGASRQDLARFAPSLGPFEQQTPQDAPPAADEDSFVPTPEAMTRSWVAPTATLSPARASSSFVGAAPSLPTTPSLQRSPALEPWSSVQTSTALWEPQPEGVPASIVQRAPAREWTAVAAADAPAASATPAAPQAAESPAPGGVDDEARMEDLAGKLYDRIRVRLRNELLVDRERAGFLTDLR